MKVVLIFLSLVIVMAVQEVNGQTWFRKSLENARQQLLEARRYLEAVIVYMYG